MKISSDNKKFYAAIFSNLAKALDYLCRDLFTAKWKVFGIDRNALKFNYGYLNDRSQKTKVASSFSAYLGVIFGVPQESILGSLLFNIDLCNLFFEDYSSDFANFANDTTPYECGPKFSEVSNNLWEKGLMGYFINLKANNSKRQSLWTCFSKCQRLNNQKQQLWEIVRNICRWQLFIWIPYK